MLKCLNSNFILFFVFNKLFYKKTHMKFVSYLLFLFFISPAFAQPATYTVANAHSHNDYEHPVPFWTAYNAGFGSIEADIFLWNGELLVAHEQKELSNKRSLESLYLKPLQSCIEKNHGYVYGDTAKELQLLIDIKTDSISTLNKLVAILQNYPTLITNPKLKLVITGGRPTPDKFTSYPPYILFDGNIADTYSTTALSKIAMMSSSFQDYSKWNGKGVIDKKEKEVVEDQITKVHGLQKRVRFWAAPDLPNAWNQFIRMGIDYINTDHIPELSAYLIKVPNRTAGK